MVERIDISTYLERPPATSWSRPIPKVLFQKTSYIFDLKPMKRKRKIAAFLDRIFKNNSLYSEKGFTVPTFNDFRGILKPDPMHEQFTLTPPLFKAKDEPTNDNILKRQPVAKEQKIANKEKLLKAFGLFFCLKGVLKQHKSGLVYLSFPIKTMRQIFLMLKSQNNSPHANTHASLLPSFTSGLGPHIPVILPGERKQNFNKQIKELGQTFYFCIKDIHLTDLPEKHHIKDSYHLSIESYELEDLRQKYNLMRSLRASPFIAHIAHTINPTMNSHPKKKSNSTRRIAPKLSCRQLQI